MAVCFASSGSPNIVKKRVGFINSVLSAEDDPLIARMKKSEESLLSEQRRAFGMKSAHATESDSASSEDMSSLSVRSYLSPSEQKKWDAMSQSKRERILKRAKRKRAFVGFDRILSQQEAIKQEEIRLKKAQTSSFSDSRGAASDMNKNMDINDPLNADTPATNTTSDISIRADSTNLVERSGRTAVHTTKQATKSTVTVAGTGVSAAVDAATGGTAEIVKAGAKAAKKVASEISRAVQSEASEKSQFQSAELEQSQSHSDGVFKTIIGLPQLAIAAVITAVMQSILPILLGMLPIILLVSLLTSIFTPIASITERTMNVVGISDEVLKYENLVLKYCKEFGIEEYEDYILAIMMVESGGRGDDVMYSSESLGLPPGSLKPEESIKQGCKCFAGHLKRAEEAGCDIWTAVQSYNYGGGFTSYVTENGKTYKLELAESFSKDKAKGVTVRYSNPIAVEHNGGWRYAYGNMFYVPLVKQYLVAVDYDSESAKTIIETAKSFIGTPYVWGGSSPDGFDCSGFTMYCFGKAGINLPHSAQGQYDKTKHFTDISEAQPGDLVFYTGTYKTSKKITHVEIYVGGGKTIGAGDPVGYHDITSGYYKAHFYSFGYIPRTRDSD